jgi:hypothetical protein
VENPDPKRYRLAEVALQLDEHSYRGFLSRGLISGHLLRLLGGGEWDFRRPYLRREETERFRQHLTELGVEARWEGDMLVVSDPDGRWRPARMGPNRHDLYQVGVFGRPLQPGSGFQREWEEVVPLPREAPLKAETIARALDSGLPLGPGFDRIEREVDVSTLIDSLSLCRTDYARERLCILLAHHQRALEAVEALPLLVEFLERQDKQLRTSAAYAVGTIVDRAGPRRARGTAPGLVADLRERWAREEDDQVLSELEAALGALGQPPPKPPEPSAEWFVQEARRALDFLLREYEFEEPTVEDRWSSTSMTYRNDTTAVAASADWRDDVVEVFLVKLEQGAIPLYLNGVTNYFPPSLFLQAVEGQEHQTGLPSPRDRDETRRFLERESEALRRCEDVLRGDFTRFDLAIAYRTSDD